MHFAQMLCPYALTFEGRRSNPPSGATVENKLSRRINLLESLRADMESKYGPTDAIVLDLVWEIKSLQSKKTDMAQRNAETSTKAAKESGAEQRG